MRRVGQREAPALPVFHENVDVLTGEKLQPLVGGELQINDHYVRGDAFHPVDTAWQRFDFNVFYCPDFAAFDNKFRRWHSTAKKCHACLFLHIRQRGGGIAAEIDGSLYDFALAGAASAVPAAIGQWETLTKCGLKHSFPGLSKKDMFARLDGDLMRHRLSQIRQLLRVHQKDESQISRKVFVYHDSKFRSEERRV